MTVIASRPSPVETSSPRSTSCLKLLHVITSMDPKEGGPPEGIRQMGKTLIGMGHSIEVVCLDRPGAFANDHHGLQVHAVGPSVGKFGYARTLVPWLKANVGRFDGVIAHGIWQYPCLAAWRVCSRSATPYFVFTHGMLDPWFQRTFPLKHLKKAAYWRAGGHKVLRDARGVFFTSQEERILASQSFRPYRCQAVTVGFGTTGAGGDADQLRTAFFESFPHLTGKTLLLYLGRVNPKKGADLLIEAFANVVPQQSQVHLVIAGPDSGDYKSLLQQQAQRLAIGPVITWTGPLTDAQKWGAFYAADLFCLPSHQENFALGAAEALACGLPVLISNKVNIWREIESAGAGFVDRDDVDGTASSLKRFLRLSADEHAKMRERASGCFERHFKIETAASALVHAVADRGA
jgi:glycosyltransferase involved in cell wall biosynthesis